MNTTLFEDKFVELQSEIISLSLELPGVAVNQVYIYISIEAKSEMFNAFFKVDNQVKTLNMFNLDQSMIMNFLQIGAADIQRIKALCAEYNAPVPKEMKIFYDVNTGKYSVDYQYESVCSDETGITSGTTFMNWISENS
ncbi:MAG: hypothetical protein ACRC1D_09185 [Culicoidibacterales bacterium]